MWAYATFFKHKIGFYKVSRTVWVRQMYSLLLNVFVLSHEWGVIFLYTNFILLEQAGSEVAEMCLLHLVTHLKKKKKKKSDSWMGTDAALWESNWFRWVLWVKKKKDFSRPKLCECLRNKTLNLYLDRAIAERLNVAHEKSFSCPDFCHLVHRNGFGPLGQVFTRLPPQLVCECIYCRYQGAPEEYLSEC